MGGAVGSNTNKALESQGLGSPRFENSRLRAAILMITSQQCYQNLNGGQKKEVKLKHVNSETC